MAKIASSEKAMIINDKYLLVVKNIDFVLVTGMNQSNLLVRFKNGHFEDISLSSNDEAVAVLQEIYKRINYFTEVRYKEV